MPILRRVLPALALFAFSAPGVASTAPHQMKQQGFDEATSKALMEALSAHRDSLGAPGAAQVVLKGDARWAGASGWADKGQDRPVGTEDVFRIASITKTYVAAVLVDLSLEGRLSLDDLASKWVPEAPYGHRYTIRQVLGHQTGLEDYVRTPRFALGLGKVEGPVDLMRYIAHKPLLFEPGSDYKYSNTNYLIAGLAIEAVTGRPWQAEVQDRILKPLGLSQSYLPSIEDEPVDLVRGYVGPKQLSPAMLDVTGKFEPGRSWAAGEMAATAYDVARFAQELFSGRLLGEDVARIMTTEGRKADGSGTGAGLGVKITQTPFGRLLGHSGSTVSYQSRVHVLEGTDIAICSLTNSFFAEADVLDEAAWKVLMGEKIGTEIKLTGATGHDLFGVN